MRDFLELILDILEKKIKVVLDQWSSRCAPMHTSVHELFLCAGEQIFKVPYNNDGVLEIYSETYDNS